MSEEERQLLSSDEKTLMTHGKYSETLTLNKEGLKKAWQKDCETKGRFQRFDDWLRQSWRVDMWRDSDGLHISLYPVRENNGQNH